MSSKLHLSLLGEDWLLSFQAFRINPDTFLDKKKFTRDGFCLDVLKDLYMEDMDIQIKIHLLLLLQEHSSILITDINLLEQVIGSLKNLFSITKSDKWLLKSQLLVTIVTVLLSWSWDEEAMKFIMSIKGFLLEIIYSKKEYPVILSSACTSLEEIEKQYPGILESEISNIATACERELSPAFQSFTLLLSLCVKRMTEKNINQKEDMPQNISEKIVNKDQIEISPLVSHLLELLPFMTPIAMYRVLKDLVYVVKSTQLPATTFKLYLQHLIVSSDVPLFHLSFELLDIYGADLFTSQEIAYLMRHLIKLSTHPCLTSSHRLLFLDWLKTCLSKTECHSSYSLKNDLIFLLPGPFDGPLTLEKKCHVLTLGTLHKDVAVEFLNESVVGLVKCSAVPEGTKAAPSLFRSIFVFFSICKVESMQDAIYKLLTSLIKTSPSLTPYILNFIKAAKEDPSERKFHENTVNHLVQHILSIPMKQFCNNLESYLAVLENASKENATICKPRGVLRLLQKLLNGSNNKKCEWLTGNDILSICRSFLTNHDTFSFYYDLAEVLCLLVVHTDDTDVKDRAKVYYSMLTSLSKMKIQNILNLKLLEKDSKDPLNSFVTGGESFQSASRVQNLSTPIFQIKRVNSSTKELEETEDETSLSDDVHDILKIYTNHIDAEETTIPLSFNINHTEDCDNMFSDLYSIVIMPHFDPVCKNISGFRMPALKKCNSGEISENIVNIYFTPQEPHPHSVKFWVEFTCVNGCSYGCNLKSELLSFDTLFTPLPIPLQYQICKNSWRKQLFNCLWEDLIGKSNSIDKNMKCSKSTYCFNLSKEQFFHFVKTKWTIYVVEKISNYEFHVAMHIPTHYHILMKTSVINDKPLVNILIDNINMLPWITSYLQNIESQN